MTATQRKILDPAVPRALSRIAGIGIGILAVHDRLQVGRGQHVPDVGQQSGDAADDDGQHHRLGDPPRRVVDLLGHIAARLEAVEQEQPAQRRSRGR